MAFEANKDHWSFEKKEILRTAIFNCQNSASLISMQEGGIRILSGMQVLFKLHVSETARREEAVLPQVRTNQERTRTGKGERTYRQRGSRSPREKERKVPTQRQCGR